MHKTSYNVQYNVPRYQIGMPGRQNRISDGVLRITPGLTEAIEFHMGNQDGVPLNLNGFDARFVVWTTDSLSQGKLEMGHSDIVLSKKIQIDDPYASRFELVLEDNETMKIGHETTTGLRWTIMLINEDKQVFPMEVSRYHQRFGTIVMDIADGVPSAELIRGS